MGWPWRASMDGTLRLASRGAWRFRGDLGWVCFVPFGLLLVDISWAAKDGCRINTKDVGRVAMTRGSDLSELPEAGFEVDAGVGGAGSTKGLDETLAHEMGGTLGRKGEGDTIDGIGTKD